MLRHRARSQGRSCALDTWDSPVHVTEPPEHPLLTAQLTFPPPPPCPEVYWSGRELAL